MGIYPFHNYLFIGSFMAFPYLAIELAKFALLAGGITYLLNDALPDASESSDYEAVPYIPPFTGGQSVGVNYLVIVEILFNITPSTPYYSAGINRDTSGTVSYYLGSGQYKIIAGKIESISFSKPNASTLDVFINGSFFFQSGFVAVGQSNASPVSARIKEVYRLDGQPDIGGNLPNPDPPPQTNENGLSNRNEPAEEDFEDIREGLAPIAVSGALAAALAALRAATDILEAVAALADAIKAIEDLLKDKENKDEDKDKKLSIYSFGRISRDGYFDLYPSGSTIERECLYIELELMDIPGAYGRFFGRRSPNYFRFFDLGYISFVTPTYGILETHRIRFGRVAFIPPEYATGFYYHLGLNGVIKANCVGFYADPQPVEVE